MLFLASEAPNGNQFAGDINEVYWGSIAFFVVIALLYKFAWPFIKSGFAGRTERIEAELKAAAEARAAAEAALVSETSELPDVSAEAERLLADAKEAAAKLKADIIAKAHSEADELKLKAAADISNQTSQAMGDVRDEFARLTRDATQKIVETNLDDESHADLIDSYIAKVGG